MRQIAHCKSLYKNSSIVAMVSWCLPVMIGVPSEPIIEKFGKSQYFVMLCELPHQLLRLCCVQHSKGFRVCEQGNWVVLFSFNIWIKFGITAFESSQSSFFSIINTDCINNFEIAFFILPEFSTVFLTLSSQFTLGFCCIIIISCFESFSARSETTTRSNISSCNVCSVSLVVWQVEKNLRSWRLNLSH